MHFANPGLRSRTAAHSAAVDPALNLDMRFGFELQVPFPDVGAVIVLQGPFDIDWMGFGPSMRLL
jgi:hypothetical protein